MAVAIVSASGAVIVAVAGLVVNAMWIGKTFNQLDKRMETMEKTTIPAFKEALLAEMKAFRVEILSEFRRLETKIDSQMERHVAAFHK